MLSWKYRSLMKFEINRKAEHILFRIIQKERLPEEFRSLTANHKVQRDSKLIQFRPFLGDDGLIRASRRLQLSNLEEDTKHPVIMADHVLTVLLFRFIHESNMHLGVEGCVALARRRFATIACRRLFRRIKTTFISPDSTATTRQSAIFDSLLFPFLLFFSVSVFFSNCILYFFLFLFL